MATFGILGDHGPHGPHMLQHTMFNVLKQEETLIFGLQ